MGSLLNGVAAVLEIILQTMMVLIFASVLISWVGADPNNQIVTMIRSLTEPLYRPLRKLTRNLPGPLDWAPMILVLIIVFLMRGVIPLLRFQANGAGPSF